jgi:hypothetical protein
MRVLIIGAGWYGCHLASYLLSKGHQITIVDKENAFFTGSSSKNQNRLHLGYHYPRSPETIKECQEGYVRFKTKYPELSTDIDDNVYFIAKQGSKTSAKSFMEIFPEVYPSTCILPIDIKGVCVEYFKTKERYIDFNKAREHFKKLLGKYLVCISTTSTFSSVDNIRKYFDTPFDFVLNCTYNRLESFGEGTFETFTTLLYRIDTPRPFAYTIMDGEYYSMFPFSVDEKIYTVTSVKDGPRIADVNAMRQSIDTGISTFIPSWADKATFVGSYVSYKTKPKSTTDDRSVRLSMSGNVISIYGGKITGIFHAEELLNQLLSPSTSCCFPLNSDAR